MICKLEQMPLVQTIEIMWTYSCHKIREVKKMPVYLKTRQHTIKNKGIYVSVSCTSRHDILTSRHHILNNRIQINIVSDSIL